jgi:adenylate kinase family enzyme
MQTDREKPEPILIQYIRDRVFNKNKNFVMIFVGATGSGKSYSALRLAEQLDSTFNIDRVCFKPTTFMNQVNELVEKSEKGESIVGRVVMWDELGASHSAREFMTVSNRVLNYFFQTSRHLNLIVLMTVPLLSFIDSNTRKLCHAVGEMQAINRHDKTGSVKVKMIQTNVLTGKEYPKFLRFKKNDKNLVAKKIRFKLPSKELTELYEAKKKAFTTQLNKDIMNKLLKAEQKDNSQVKPIAQTNILKPLTTFQQQILHCLKSGITKQRDIAKKLGVECSKVCHNVAYIRKKGIYVGKRGELQEIEPEPQEPRDTN